MNPVQPFDLTLKNGNLNLSIKFAGVFDNLQIEISKILPE